MDQLVDYIRWVGSLDFQSYPFREADALVLCTISYFDLNPVFAEAGTVMVRDCIPMIESGKAALRVTGGDMGYSAVFEAAVRSRRFGSLIMRDYEDVLRQEPALQFSAVTFQNDAKGQAECYSGISEAMTNLRQNASIGCAWKENIERDFRQRGKR